MTAAGPRSVPSSRLSPRLFGYLGAENQIVLAIALAALINVLRQPVGPPEAVNRGLALGLIYALPALVGALGAWAGRRSLLAAASVACAVGSVLSFSGVTLLFLVPAVLFAIGAAAPRVRSSAPPGPATAPTTAARVRSALGGLVLAIVLAALMVGSGVSLLALTEARCWVGEENPSGVIVYRIVPDINGLSEGKGETSGCSSADLTVQGGVVAAFLGVAALGLAIRTATARRQDEPDDRPDPPRVTEAEVTT
jgi:hypothetical protein